MKEMDNINPTEQECAPSPNPVMAYSGDAQSKGPETDIQLTGQVPESRPQPAIPLLDIAQARQLQADGPQTSIAGNSNTINYNTTYVINNDNSSKKTQKKKKKKDKKKKSHKSKGVQVKKKATKGSLSKRKTQDRNAASSKDKTNGGERGRKRPCSGETSEESEKKKKKASTSSAPEHQSRVKPLGPSDKHNRSVGVSVSPLVPRSKLSTVLLHRKLDKSKSLHLHIQEVDIECEKREKKFLPGKFIVADSWDWGYLLVFGNAKKSLLKKDKSIMLRHITCVEENIIKCNGTDVEPLQSPVSVPEKVIEKMRKEEKFATLASITKGNYEKIKVLVNKVDDQEMLSGKNGKPYPRRRLEVTDIRRSGKLGKVHSLSLYNKAARSKACKPGVKVIICNVGKAENGQYRTYQECLVRKYVE